MFDQLKNLKGLASMLGNPSGMREKLEQIQRELEKMTAEGDAGAGAVRVTVNGKLRVVSMQLEPALIATLAGEGADADREMIEDLILAATNDALQQAQQMAAGQLGKLTGELDLPALDGLLGGD